MVRRKKNPKNRRSPGRITRQLPLGREADTIYVALPEPEWEKLRREINIASKNTLVELAGINDDTFGQIKSNRPYHRLNELEDLSSLDHETYLKLTKREVLVALSSVI